MWVCGCGALATLAALAGVVVCFMSISLFCSWIILKIVGSWFSTVSRFTCYNKKDKV